MLSTPVSPVDKAPAVGKTIEAAVLVAAGGVVALAVLYPIVNTDIWWHLAAGRRIVQDKAFLRSDPWSSTTSGPWFDIHWGFQVLCFALYKVGGLRAIVVAKTVTAVIGALLPYGAVRRRGDPVLAWWFAAWIASAVWCARPLLMARPIVVSLLCVSWFVLALERYRAGTSKGLWFVAALPLLQLVWSNVQPVFVLGWVIVGAYAGGELAEAFLARRGWRGAAGETSFRRAKVLIFVAVGCVVASLVTPYGIAGLRVPFSLFFRIDPHGSDIFSVNVSENVSPLFLDAAGQTSLFVGSFKWIAALAWGSFLLPPRRMDLSRMVLLAAFFATALFANRNILVFSWLAAPYAASNFADFTREVSKETTRRGYWLRGMSALVGTGVLFAVGALAVRQLGAQGALSDCAPFRVPSNSVATLERLTKSDDRPVHVFSSARYGGYLIWRFDSEVRVAMDGRFILRSAQEFEKYLEAVDRPESFDVLAAKQGYDAVVLPISHPQRYQRLIRYLARSRDWALTETDGTTVVFVSRGVAHATPGIETGNLREDEQLRVRIERRYSKAGPVRDQALINLARTYYLLGEERRALVELSRVKRPDARVLGGRIYLTQGKWVEAIAQARTALALEDDFVPARLLLAEVALAANNATEALEQLEAVLECQPGHKRARELVLMIASLDAR